jgi:basic membrane lipoprotein Med (substrate-binding protein (PBP1-ABC) superfamily)
MHRFFCCLSILVALSSCSGIDDDATSPQKQATVTLMVTPNGLGDNGFNDTAAEGFFAFGHETGTNLRLLLPSDLREAEEMYSRWLADNTQKDSAVLILGSSEYESMAFRGKPALSGKGSRVMLVDSAAEIEGVSSIMIGRYGVSYLAGAMCQRLDALVLAAAPGFPSLEESIAGFMDARKKYAGEFWGDPCTTSVHYIADSEAGFAMPDSTYRYMVRRADQDLFYSEIVFPLLGGSGAGVLRYINDDEYTFAMMIGMDVDLAGQSTRIPFSVVIRIGDVLKQYLEDWLAGRDWPESRRLGLKEGAADIVLTPNFADHLLVYEDRGYGVPDWFKWLYDDYKSEAVQKEEEYESN